MKIVEIKILRGPNYWSIRRPKLIQMKLDLEEMEQVPTNKIEGFKEKLVKIIGFTTWRSDSLRAQIDT